MEYTVSKLAHLSGVSARTLRYYDEIDLLKPKRVSSSGYRIYGQEEVNLLQQILFYREMEMPLNEIEEIIYSEDFEAEQALKHHLNQLKQEKSRLESLIQTVEKSLQAEKGEVTLKDQEKFEAFKKEKLRRNEEQFGTEIREKYGEEAVEQSNKTFKYRTQEDYERLEQLTETLNVKLAAATKEGQAEGPLGQEVAALHQQWIMQAWPKGYYSKEKHYNLSRMYIEDPRFKAYYDKLAPDAAEFLHEALKIYLHADV